MTDADLIARAAHGDRSAFRLLVERHRAMVYRVAFQYAGNHHDADDIAQEVFVKVYRSLGGFRQDAQFTSWLYRIVMNACIDHRRRNGTAAVSLDAARDDERAFEVAAAEPGPESHAYAAELKQAVGKAVDQLPPQQRVIFCMRHFEGMKLVDIAAALGVAEGTVKRQLHSAVHRLRRSLRPLHQEVRHPRVATS